MSIEKLKEQARRHEQKEEWHKALDQYRTAIERLAEEDQPDIGLYNRVGDLYVRVGNLDEAVVHYEQAVDLYTEAELPNNAIAVCKKVIRNVPDRHVIYLKMGQIRAQQGFMPDARTNYLTYAERVAQAGDVDESLRALAEFADLAPEDVDLRLFVAEQMASHDRAADAVEQLSQAYRHLMLTGDSARAAEVEARVRELDPNAALEAPAAAAGGSDDDAFELGSGIGDDGEIVAQFGEIEIGSGDEEAADTVEEAVEEEAGAALGGFEISTSDDEDEGDEEAVELPMMSFDDEDEGDEEAVDLPMMSFEEEADEAEEAPELPTTDFGSGDDDALPTFDAEDERGDTALPTFAEVEAEAATDSETEAEAEEAFDLPTFDSGDEADVAEVEEGGLGVEDFGEVDPGDREAHEYIEGPQEMEEIDLGLSEVGSEAAEAVEEAVEEAASEAATEVVAEEVAEAPAEEAPEAPPEAPETAAEAPETAAEAPAEEPGELTLDDLRSRIAESPDDLTLHQRMVETAYATGDDGVHAEAYLGLAQALERDGQDAKAKAAYQQVLQVDPENEAALAGVGRESTRSAPVKEVASHEDYVDLGAMILGDETEKTTRFVVAYEEPSGDEDADFARMLSQFKDKVSENLDADDFRAHHDLGTAYKEMGLLDEAIAEYQQALRASADHLPTYELMGQTFLEMHQPEAAVRSLERALEVESAVEDELVGIYYYLGRAHEELGKTEQAVEYYDRVFSLDINFADVTDRLRTLR